jgi:Na+/proline symporter
MVKIEEELRARIGHLGFIFALLSLLALLQQYFGLSRIEFLATFALMGIAVLMIVVWSGFSALSKEINDGFKRTGDILQRHLNPLYESPSEEKQEVVRTTGAGAFTGMVVGGLSGLILGPVGVVVGGMVGAIIGDEVEREKIKGEMRRKTHRKQ